MLFSLCFDLVVSGLTEGLSVHSDVVLLRHFSLNTEQVTIVACIVIFLMLITGTPKYQNVIISSIILLSNFNFILLYGIFFVRYNYHQNKYLLRYLKCEALFVDHLHCPGEELRHLQSTLLSFCVVSFGNSLRGE